MRTVIVSILCVFFAVIVSPPLCMPDPCGVPPFVGVGSKPNIMIILDNSNSMDEDFYGAAVGSYSQSSKSVVARQSLMSAISEYHDRLRVGVMAFTLTGVSKQWIHNSPYFVSYDPRSYCPPVVDGALAPASCVDYCQTGSSSSQADCQSNCSSRNAAFNATYRDEIIKRYTIGTEQRNRYCTLVYPKTMRLANPTDPNPNHYIYTKAPYPFYASPGQGTAFCYSPGYCATEGTPYDSYACYYNKNGTSDGNTGYTPSSPLVYNGQLTPTDSDFALGFYDFGRRLTWKQIGPTWFSSTNPTSNQGYIYCKVGDIASTTSGNYTSLTKRLKSYLNDNSTSTGYMNSTCTSQSVAGNCGIINAGQTPTAGALQKALTYFNTSTSTPILNACQKNFIIFVTDGLPSVNETGGTNSTANLMPAVLSKLDSLRSGFTVGGSGNYTVKTYMLGVGLSPQAKTYLDQMAVHGGTADANDGHAFYANNSTQFVTALETIFGQVGRATASAGAVATVSQELHSGDIVVRGAFRSYQPSDPGNYVWQGHLESYWPYRGCTSLNNPSANQTFVGWNCTSTAGCTWNSATSNCTGSIYSFQLSQNQASFCPDIGGNSSCIDGGQKLSSQQTPSNRTIFTWLNSLKTNFVTPVSANLALKTAMNNTLDVNGNGTVTTADTDALINWVRGVNATGARRRQGWPLGDIVYSTPVTAGTPSLGAVAKPVAMADCTSGTCSGTVGDNCFYCYRTNNLYRDQMVYVGANDGMLHGFNLGKYRASQKDWVFNPSVNATLGAHLGEERWAYIPSNFLSTLQELAKPSYGTGNAGACRHRTTVDLSPQVFDVHMARGWRTILLGGERDGGDVYFALDVTDPANATILWEHSTLKNFPAPSSSTIGTTLSTYYKYLKNIAMTRSVPAFGRLRDANSTTNNPNVSISGGATREFQPGSISLNATTTLGTKTGWQYLYYPTFRAVNLATGADLWKSTFAALLGSSSYTNYFGVNSTTPSSSKIVMPWAVSNPAAFDLYNANQNASIASGSYGDGYADLVYAGDLNGTFYTLRLNSLGTLPTPTPLCMITRKTKAIPSSYTNAYRGSRQPITVTPIASLDDNGYLRLFFGTGKFDNVSTSNDDKRDTAAMTFYCLKENINSPIPCDGASLNATTKVSPSGSVIGVYEKCRASSATHTWIKKQVVAGGQNMTQADGDSCFPCSIDLLDAGERVTDSALVAGGYVFFTTFMPDSSPCVPGGVGRLYVLDYMCRPLQNNYVLTQPANVDTGSNSTYGHLRYYNPMTAAGAGPGSWARGNVPSSVGTVGALVMELGSGMPSRPVLDSSGTSIMIQTSDERLLRLTVDIGEDKKTKVQGWTRDPSQ